jgi:uncharacterized glyoxalase superfamily protein PhnB
MTTRTDHNVWPGLSYDDAYAARAWLTALGFEEGIVVEGERAGEIQHSEMLWPDGGRVMVHSRGKADETFTTPRGSGNIYVVCDDPDAVWGKAQALAATVLRPMEDTDYGSRGFSIADAEGNAWSFGTYAGED